MSPEYREGGSLFTQVNDTTLPDQLNYRIQVGKYIIDQWVVMIVYRV